MPTCAPPRSQLEAARNRLAILGKTEAEITAFQEQGKISSETPIYAPLTGTVVQRKIGPGQYVSYTSTGARRSGLHHRRSLDGVAHRLSSARARRRRSAPASRLDFTMLAYPNTMFKATIDHVAASLDPSIRRLMVRATIDNSKGQFKPRDVHVGHDLHRRRRHLAWRCRASGDLRGRHARVWVARSDKTIEVRQIKAGMTRGGLVQVLQGLQPGESVVTKGSLFVDQAAGSPERRGWRGSVQSAHDLQPDRAVPVRGGRWS